MSFFLRRAKVYHNPRRPRNREFRDRATRAGRAPYRGKEMVAGLRLGENAVREMGPGAVGFLRTMA